MFCFKTIFAFKAFFQHFKNFGGASGFEVKSEKAYLRELISPDRLRAAPFCRRNCRIPVNDKKMLPFNSLLHC